MCPCASLSNESTKQIDSLRESEQLAPAVLSVSKTTGITAAFVRLRRCNSFRCSGLFEPLPVPLPTSDLNVGILRIHFSHQLRKGLLGRFYQKWYFCILGQTSFFFVSRYAYAPALIFANQLKNAKKLSALSDFLHGIPTQSLRVSTGTVGSPPLQKNLLPFPSYVLFGRWTHSDVDCKMCVWLPVSRKPARWAKGPFLIWRSYFSSDQTVWIWSAVSV